MARTHNVCPLLRLARLHLSFFPFVAFSLSSAEKGGRPITFSFLPLLSVSPDTPPSSFSLPRRNYTSRGLAGRRRERGRNWKGHTLRKDAISQRAANLTLLQSHDAGGAHGNSQSTYSKKNCRSSTLGHSLAEVRFHGGNQYRRAVTICPPTTNRFRGGISIRKAKKEAVFKRTKRRRERWKAEPIRPSLGRWKREEGNSACGCRHVHIF